MVTLSTAWTEPFPVSTVASRCDVMMSDLARLVNKYREFSLRVFVKDQGVWRIRAFHNTLLQP